MEIFLDSTAKLLSKKKYSALGVEPISFMQFASKHKDESLPFFHQDMLTHELEQYLIAYLHKTGIGERVLYSKKLPLDHNAIPSSLFRLALSSHDKKLIGCSLELANTKQFTAALQRFVNTKGINLRNLKITGVYLCPDMDIPILIAIIQQLLDYTDNSFHMTKEDLDQADWIKISFWDLIKNAVVSLNNTSYSEEYYTSKAFIDKLISALARIMKLTVSFDMDNRITDIQPLIPRIQYDHITHHILVKPSFILFLLFRGDKVLRVNREIINNTSSKISTLLLRYLITLPVTIDGDSRRISTPVETSTLIYVCFPNETDDAYSPGTKLYTKLRKKVSLGMRELKKANYINFKTHSRQHDRIYFDIQDFTSMLSQKFKQKFLKPKSTAKNEDVRSYLTNNPPPRSRCKEIKLAYAEEHMINLKWIVHSHKTLALAFKGMRTVELERLNKLNKILEDSSEIQPKQKKELVEFYELISAFILQKKHERNQNF